MTELSTAPWSTPSFKFARMSVMTEFGLGRCHLWEGWSHSKAIYHQCFRSAVYAGFYVSVQDLGYVKEYSRCMLTMSDATVEKATEARLLCSVDPWFKKNVAARLTDMFWNLLPSSFAAMDPNHPPCGQSSLPKIVTLVTCFHYIRVYKNFHIPKNNIFIISKVCTHMGIHHHTFRESDGKSRPFFPPHSKKTNEWTNF